MRISPFIDGAVGAEKQMGKRIREKKIKKLKSNPVKFLKHGNPGQEVQLVRHREPAGGELWEQVQKITSKQVSCWNTYKLGPNHDKVSH